MKNKFLFALIIFTSVVSIAFAQKRTPKSPEERAQNITNRLEKKLILSEDQKTQVYQINLEAAQKNDDLKAQVKNQELDREEFIQQRLDNEKERDSKIEALLTEEQKPKYEEIKEKARQRMKDRSQNKRGNRKKGADTEDDM